MSAQSDYKAAAAALEKFCNEETNSILKRSVDRTRVDCPTLMSILPISPFSSTV